MKPLLLSTFVFAALASLSLGQKAQAADLTVTATGGRLLEGNSGRSNAVFRVTLSQTPTTRVGMQFTTLPGTATADKDYVTTRGTLFFDPGVRSQVVVVPVIGDTDSEKDESFYLNITVTGYTVAQPAAAFVIRNDDRTPGETAPGIGKVVFGVIDDSYQIWTMNADGTNQTRLTPPNADYYNSEFDVSPDGSKIAYVVYDYNEKTDNIWTMNADGSNKTRLTRGLGFNNFPRWSPDGTRLLFLSTREGDSKLFAMNANGSQPVRISSMPTRSSFYSWSPDSRRIVFAVPQKVAADLFLASADGKTTTRLTNDNFYDGLTTWTPDGSRIVFVSSRAGGQQLFSVDWSGKVVQQLTSDTRYSLDQPTFSPDGTRLAFSSAPVSGSAIQIECMNADGSGRFFVTRLNRGQSDPHWTPDGSRIVYTVGTGGNLQGSISATVINTLETQALTARPRSYWPRTSPGFVPPPSTAQSLAPSAPRS